MGTSLVPTVVTKLVELLRAQIDDWKVLDTPPIRDKPKKIVYIGNVREIRHEYAVMRAGRKPREETFGVDVHFEEALDTPGANASEARANVMAKIAVLENLIADDPTLGLSATNPTLRTTGVQSDVGISPPPEGTQGWRAKGVARVGVAVRLT